MWKRAPLLLGLAALAVVALPACGGGSQTTSAAEAPSAAQTSAVTTSAPATAGTTPPSLPQPTTTAPASAPFRATLSVSTQEPTATTSWPYELEITDPAGKPIQATITVQVVDPLQQPHPVELGRTTTELTDWPIDGTFADDVIWPVDSIGVPLTFRILVQAAGGSATLTVPVRVRST